MSTASPPPKVACPHCQALIKAPALAAGSLVNCPKCGKGFRLGEKAGQEEAENRRQGTGNRGQEPGVGRQGSGDRGQETGDRSQKGAAGGREKLPAKPRPETSRVEAKASTEYSAPSTPLKGPAIVPSAA